MRPFFKDVHFPQATISGWTLVTTLAMLLIFGVVHPGAQEEAEILDAKQQEHFIKTMQEKLMAARSLIAPFHQRRYMSVFKDELVTSGIYYFQAPDRLRWELKEPYRSIIIFNQDRVAKFDFVDGHIRKMNIGIQDILKTVLKQNIAMMRGNFTASQKSFLLQVIKKDNYELVLKPRSKGLKKNINSISLLINKDNYQIMNIRINEPHGDYIVITFEHARINEDINAAIFDLMNPVQ